jgi:hypothetical protein
MLTTSDFFSHKPTEEPVYELLCWNSQETDVKEQVLTTTCDSQEHLDSSFHMLLADKPPD